AAEAEQEPPPRQRHASSARPGEAARAGHLERRSRALGGRTPPIWDALTLPSPRERGGAGAQSPCTPLECASGGSVNAAALPLSSRAERGISAGGAATLRRCAGWRPRRPRFLGQGSRARRAWDAALPALKMSVRRPPCG